MALLFNQSPLVNKDDELLNEHRRQQRQAVLKVLSERRQSFNGLHSVAMDMSKKAGRSIINWRRWWGGHKKTVVLPVAHQPIPKVTKVTTMVTPYQIKRHWFIVILATIILLIGAGWISIYKFGAHGPAVRLVAKILPLPAGRVNHQTILLHDVLERLDVNNYLTKVAKAKTDSKLAADPKSVFGELVNNELIHQELAARQQLVDKAIINNEYDKMSRSFKTVTEFNNWVQRTYGVNLTLFNKVILSPWLERQRLAVILISQQTNYPAAWEQAKKTSLSRNLTDLEDLGWVSAADLPDGLPEIVANLTLGIRTQPFVTSDGLMVLLVTEKLVNENNVPNWHLWQKLIPVPAITDFLTAARANSDIRYYLP